MNPLTASIEYCKRVYGSGTRRWRDVMYGEEFTLEPRREVYEPLHYGAAPIPAVDFAAWWNDAR